MAYRRPPVPPKGLGVFHIPRSLLDELVLASGLKPEWVLEMHLYAGQGTVKLSVPFIELADPLVDAAGLDPDSYTSNSDRIEEVFGPHRWRRSSDNPDYQGEVEVYVVDDRKEVPRARPRRGARTD